jgi:hypothetical protein
VSLTGGSRLSVTGGERGEERWAGGGSNWAAGSWAAGEKKEGRAGLKEREPAVWAKRSRGKRD